MRSSGMLKKTHVEHDCFFLFHTPVITLLGRERQHFFWTIQFVDDYRKRPLRGWWAIQSGVRVTMVDTSRTARAAEHDHPVYTRKCSALTLLLLSHG